MVAPRFELFPVRLHSLGTAAPLRHLLLGFALALPAAFALALSARVLRERVGRGLWVAPIALALALGALVASCRWPELPLFAPGFASTAGKRASGIAAAAALVAALLLAPPVRWPARGAVTVLTVAAVLAAGALWLGTRDGPGRWPGRPNFVVVSCDTLRADRLGCYGYDAPTSPEIDRFAARSQVFTRAYSHSTWTLPSHMTMLTSLRPSSHGVGEERALGPAARTLAMAFREGGYDTLALVDDVVWLAPRYGFDRGFDIYVRSGGSARAKVRHVSLLLDEVGQRPFFLFAHFYDAHSDFRRLPYDSAPEDRERFAGWYRGSFNGCDGEGRCASEFLGRVVEGAETLGDEEIRYVSDLYDAGVRTLDRHLGQLFRDLEERGLLESTVVVVTADHGEQFLEHGSVLHGAHYEECVRVPLLIRTPETAGARTEVLAGLLDVMPTVLELAGLDSPGMEGRSLLPWLADGAGPPGGEVIFTETASHLQGMRTREWSLVRGPGGWRVYDALRDPRQERDLAGDPPEELPALLDRVRREEQLLVERAGAAGSAPSPAGLSADERARLRQLGYAGDGGD